MFLPVYPGDDSRVPLAVLGKKCEKKLLVIKKIYFDKNIYFA